MKENLATKRETAPARSRTIASILLIMLVVMIIRDIFVRRWSAH
jgi:hypothetical protein